MELELRASDLLVAPYDDGAREHEITVEHDATEYTVRFRLPTADDLGHASALAIQDLDQGAVDIFARCVVRAVRSGEEIDVARLPLTVRDAVADAMAQRDPQAEIELDLTCPACGSAFSLVFDTATFFLQELDERATRLMHEVHTLATHYHWSEHDILRLPARRRSFYLELITEAARARVR